MAICLFCLQLVCQRSPLAPTPEPGRSLGRMFRDHISERSHRFTARLARGLLACRRLLRVPPAAANDDAFGRDLAVADQVLADDVDIVELALLDRNQGGVADAPRLEAAEFGTPPRPR